MSNIKIVLVLPFGLSPFIFTYNSISIEYVVLNEYTYVKMPIFQWYSNNLYIDAIKALEKNLYYEKLSNCDFDD